MEPTVEWSVYIVVSLDAPLSEDDVCAISAMLADSHGACIGTCVPGSDHIDSQMSVHADSVQSAFEGAKTAIADALTTHGHPATIKDVIRLEIMPWEKFEEEQANPTPLERKLIELAERVAKAREPYCIHRHEDGGCIAAIVPLPIAWAGSGVLQVLTYAWEMPLACLDNATKSPVS